MSDIQRVAELRGLGKEDRARELFDTLNHINKCCGLPPHAWPEPTRSFTGLITARADEVTPAQFLEAVVGLPPRAEHVIDEPLSELRSPEGWSHAA